MEERKQHELDLVEALRDRTAYRTVRILSAIDGPQLPYLPWYQSDFYGSPLVDAMSDQQQNWYRRLLDKSWAMPQPCFLPNDPLVIASLCRCTPLDMQGSGFPVMAKFDVTEDGKFLFSRRLLKEYAKQRKAYEGRAQAGRDSAKKRSPSTERNGQRHAEPHLTDTVSLNNHNQNHKELKTPLNGEQLAAMVMGRLKIPGNKFLLEAIMKAIAIEQQTQDLEGKRVAEWLADQGCLFQSVQNKRFSISKFFEEAHYRNNPHTWESTNDPRTEALPPFRNGLSADKRRAVNNVSAAGAVIQMRRERKAAEGD